MIGTKAKMVEKAKLVAKRVTSALMKVLTKIRATAKVRPKRVAAMSLV